MQDTFSIADRISLISVSSTARVSAEAERLRRAGEDVVDFGVGEPDFPTPANIKAAAVRAIEANFTRYTAMGGTLELRQAICDRHKADFGTEYGPAECVVSVGGKHAIFNLTQALINPGEEVVIPTPYWVTYKDVVNYAGGKCHFVETDEQEHFALTAHRVERAISHRTRLIILNSPCNPSGALIEREEFEKIAHLAKKNGIWLMTDECYSHFLYDSEPYSVASLPDMKHTVVVAGSLSKTYAMTGWRIGYTLAPPAICNSIVKLQSHSTSNPTSIAQKAAIEAVTGPQDSCSRCWRNTGSAANTCCNGCRRCRASPAPRPAEHSTHTQTSVRYSGTRASRTRWTSRSNCYRSIMWPSSPGKLSGRTTTSVSRTPLRWRS
jgi:aspartate aminotransferase